MHTYNAKIKKENLLLIYINSHNLSMQNLSHRNPEFYSEQLFVIMNKAGKVRTT